MSFQTFSDAIQKLDLSSIDWEDVRQHPIVIPAAGGEDATKAHIDWHLTAPNWYAQRLLSTPKEIGEFISSLVNELGEFRYTKSFEAKLGPFSGYIERTGQNINNEWLETVLNLITTTPALIAGYVEVLKHRAAIQRGYQRADVRFNSRPMTYLSDFGIPFDSDEQIAPIRIGDLVLNWSL